ncbi:hypothetical protein MYG64_35195 (plasmid) [Ensifer adhaerens]|uniref:hypothetical protein n=1 Tax=Ensifer adhaerens TaxID=106592 RepID=UPI002100E7A0|nr:hypothetical protein [Ensifer adhaerens]UTV40987.1 hypothetical protein MYG64_35195 [Ensifer adhaerens]
MADIGLPIPKAIVDPTKDFVGIPAQQRNTAKEINRLRKQVRRLQTRVENMGIVAIRPRRRTYRLVGAAVTIAFAGLSWALWRSRDTATFRRIISVALPFRGPGNF